MAIRGERYETLRIIASGGMATVHLGRALGAGGFERLVAIKTMHPHLATEPEFVTMFLDEARLAARIRHPNVVSTLDVQQDNDGVFLVMDYVEGPSLQQIIKTLKKTEGALPIGVMLKIFLDALAGLHAAHELRDANGAHLNLIHRDVTPHNILIGVDGIARLTDFGVARAEARLSASTNSGQLKGKVGYMSPEQARTEPIDRRTDIYAAGVILWEFLTGERLIRGESEVFMLALVAAGDHKAPREVRPSAPKALSDVCSRALHPEPDKRYATAADFAEAVEKAAEEDGIAVASARAVGEFIVRLDAHTRPVALPALPDTGVSFPPISARGRTSGPVSAVTAAGAPPSSQRAATPPSTSLPFSTTVGPVDDTGSRAQPRRSPLRLFALAFGALVIGAVAAFGLSTKRDDGRSNDVASPALSDQASSDQAKNAPPSSDQAQPPSTAPAPRVDVAPQPLASSDAGAPDSGDAGALDGGDSASLAKSSPSSAAGAASAVGASSAATAAKPGSTHSAQSGTKIPPKGPVYRPPEL